MTKATETNTTTATDPLAPNLPLTHTIDMQALRKLGAKELHDLRDVLCTLSNVTTAFGCQPRFGGEDAWTMNGAGNLLDDLTDFLHVYELAVVNVATASTPVTAEDTKRRHWTILGYQADYPESLADCAVQAAEAARDVAAAEFRERHSRAEA